MKRESLITKLVAFMLCVMMVVGCLPVGVFAEEATTSNDWESDIDVVEPPKGSQENPIIIYPMVLDENGAYTVEIPAGETYYFSADYMAGKEMTINDGEVITLESAAYAFTITNDGEAAAEYVIKFADPAGTMNNPAVATLGDNDSSHVAGSQGYYWTYTADYTGNLVVTITAEAGWTYAVSNVTVGTYGDTHWSDEETVVNAETIAVTAGDEIQIMVNTYDPDDSWNAPAGDITMNLAYEEGSCEAFPIWLYEMENTVTNEGAPYYGCYFSGTTMTVTGEGDFNVIYNGEPIAAVDGVISMPVSSANPRMPIVFAIVGDGEYSVNFTYPAGAMENPAVAVLGDNKATVAAGTQGYYWTYTAEKAGDLVVTLPADADWFYVVNNMTTYSYGDNHYSNDDPVVSSETITVAEGDEIQIMVNTYDPENPYSAPAGDVTFNLAYAVTEPEVALALVGNTLVLEGALVMNFTMATDVYEAYENVYVEFTYAGKKSIVYSSGKNSNGDRYVFSFEGISPNAYGTEIIGVPYGTYQGVEYQGISKSRSVKSYCRALMDAYKNNTNYAELCTMIVDLLHYGAAAQIYQNIKVDDLATNVLTAEEIEKFATKTDPALENIQNPDYQINEGATASITNMNLELASSVAVRFKMTLPTIDNVVLKVTCAGITYEIPASEFTLENGSYYAKLDKIGVHLMRYDILATVYQGETAISNVFLTSIESYAAKVEAAVNSGTTSYASLLTLMKAMMRYGDSAYNYKF